MGAAARIAYFTRVFQQLIRLSGPWLLWYTARTDAGNVTVHGNSTFQCPLSSNFFDSEGGLYMSHALQVCPKSLLWRG